MMLGKNYRLKRNKFLRLLQRQFSPHPILHTAIHMRNIRKAEPLQDREDFSASPDTTTMNYVGCIFV